MKKCVYVAFLMMLFACGNHRDQQVEPAKAMAGMAGDTVFTPEVQTYIQTLIDLDCKIHLLVLESVTTGETADGRDEILTLRREKKGVIEKILAINADSSFVEAVKASLQKLRNSHQNCGQSESSLGASESGKEVVKDAESMNIREDAGRLADLNCKIMSAYKRVEANSGKPEMDAALQALLREKRQMLKKLTGLYGTEVLHDGFFRRMVMEGQNEKCNYAHELEAAGRFNQFSP